MIVTVILNSIQIPEFSLERSDTQDSLINSYFTKVQPKLSEFKDLYPAWDPRVAIRFLNQIEINIPQSQFTNLYNE